MNKEEFDLKSTEMIENRVLRDAIHDYIEVDWYIIYQVINSKEMQRLRRIKQLGGTYQVFQSAEHSRFVHSLGVYQIIKKMLETKCLSSYLSDYDKLCVMLAGLLHDVGHGPFSHSFEGIFDIDHEEMSVKIILGDTEVNRLMKNIHPELPKDVASIILHTHKNQVLIQMVSSQLDADRMDYLLRDSYMTGTTYGQFDLSRILRTMRISDGHIVYKESGVQAIENYILARYHMYWQVYYHPTARSYEHLLQSVFLRIKDLYSEGYQFKASIHYLTPFLENAITVDDYLNLDESILLFYFREFQKEEDSILKDLSTRFLNRKLFKYKQLMNEEELIKIEELAQAKGYNPKYYILSDNQQQIPYLYYGENQQLNDIQILAPHRELSPLPEKSEIVSAIVSSKKYKSDEKVFFPKELKDDIKIL